MTISEGIAIAFSLGSLAIAVLAYRRAGNLKKLDQLVESGCAQNELREAYNGLTAIHQTALLNRKKVMSAISSLRSGSMEGMEAEWNSDAEAIEALNTDVENSTRSPNSMTPSQLADLLVEIDSVKRSVDMLLNRYHGWDDWDKQQGQRIREEKLAQFRAGRTSSPT